MIQENQTASHMGACACGGCSQISAQQVGETGGGTGGTAPQGADPYYIAALKSGNSWSASEGTGVSLNYKFWTSLPSYYTGADQESHDFQAFTAGMQAATVGVLNQISSFANITFTAAAAESDVQLGFGQALLTANAGAWAYYPGNYSQAGDVWTNNMYANSTQNVTKGTYGHFVLQHEIGHALGLRHSFESGLLSNAEDSSRYTVMSYTWPLYSETYMLYDIAALQKMYGANMNYATGNDTYALQSGKTYTIWDAGGTDTLDASAIATAVTLRMAAGGFSSVGKTDNIAVAYNVAIENANGGAGNDTIYDNAINNLINCNGGDDTVYCGAGNDSVNGGLGTDTVIYADAIQNFQISIINQSALSLVSAQAGTDTLSNVENFKFGNTSYTFADVLSYVGSSGSSPFVGAELRWGAYFYTFNSSMTGSTTLNAVDIGYRPGGTNNMVTFTRPDDTHLTATINSSMAPGTLIFTTTASGANVSVEGSHAKLSTTLKGGTGNDTYTVSATITGIDTVNAGDGNDIINTGNGNDMIYGGNGYDTLDGQAGNDTVYGGADADTASGGIGNDKLYGDDGNDTLNGDAGNDIFYGGIGNDTANGGDGNDTINGDAGADVLNGGAGIDKLYGGDDVDNLNGNDGNDIVNGGNGNDNVNGDLGNDKLYGDAGNDTLAGGDGNDGLYGGLGDDALYGGAGSDLLQGNEGSDLLVGGLGRDTLTGGTGSDVFGFVSPDAVMDVITDFTLGGAEADKLNISDVLSGYDAISDSISTFAKITATSATKATLYVNQDGAGIDWVAIASLTGNFTGVTASSLLDNGQLIANQPIA